MRQEQQSINSIESSLIHYKEGIGHFTDKMPNIIKKYNDFTQACFQEGSLTQKHKQLIALAISVNEQNEYCIIYHTKGCLDQGCTEDEIYEAIGVSSAFGGGASMSQSVTLVQEAMEELDSTKH
nr:carboxymuconolactone decarboxylase family protein [Virgibacillus ndiopensis]